MTATLTPAPLSGTVAAIPSKSDAHRLLICAALADAPTTLALHATSADIDATLRCLAALGAAVEWDGQSVCVQPGAPAGCPTLDCGESGSTLRFLLPVAAALCKQTRFTGSGRLPSRPLADLTAAMRAHGVAFSAEALPFETSGLLQGGDYALPGHVSSQYITGLLLALPLAAADSVLTLTSPLQSAGYVAMTRSALTRFGVEAQETEAGWRIPGNQTYHPPGALSVAGDWSNAAFFLTAGAIGKPVTVTGLDLEDPQGDRAIVDLLRQLGAAVSISGDAVTVSPAPLRGCEIDVSDVPDLLPVLAVAAACAHGETRFTGAARLRLKESDRLTAVSALLRDLGGSVTELPDGLIVRGGALCGGTVDSFHDHRLVMSAAVAAIRCTDPVTILDAGAVEKSYPAFFQDYTALGGSAHVL